MALRSLSLRLLIVGALGAPARVFADDGDAGRPVVSQEPHDAEDETEWPTGSFIAAAKDGISTPRLEIVFGVTRLSPFVLYYCPSESNGSLHTLALEPRGRRVTFRLQGRSSCSGWLHLRLAGETIIARFDDGEEFALVKTQRIGELPSGIPAPGNFSSFCRIEDDLEGYAFSFVSLHGRTFAVSLNEETEPDTVTIRPLVLGRGSAVEFDVVRVIPRRKNSYVGTSRFRGRLKDGHLVGRAGADQVDAPSVQMPPWIGGHVDDCRGWGAHNKRR